MNSQNNWLGFLRICVAFFCISQFITFCYDFELLYSKSSILIPEIANAKKDLSPFTLLSVYENFLVDRIDYDVMVKLFGVVYLVSLITLLLGFYTKASAFVAVFIHFVFMKSYESFLYGVDFYVSIALFYILIFNTQNYLSLDRLFRKKNITNENFNAFCLLILRIHLCISYFFGGFDKLLGFNWRNGESVWKALHLVNNPSSIINFDLLHNITLFTILGWVIVLIELLYPIGMNHKKTRNVWLCLIIGMHFSIALFLGLYFFAIFMIVLNVCIYYFPYLEFETSKMELRINDPHEIP